MVIAMPDGIYGASRLTTYLERDDMLYDRGIASDGHSSCVPAIVYNQRYDLNGDIIRRQIIRASNKPRVQR